jgi:hypothetical protein
MAYRRKKSYNNETVTISEAFAQEAWKLPSDFFDACWIFGYNQGRFLARMHILNERFKQVR